MKIYSGQSFKCYIQTYPFHVTGLFLYSRKRPVTWIRPVAWIGLIGLFSVTWPFHDGGRYHIETSPLICRANQWTGFYMITSSVMKELIGLWFLKYFYRQRTYLAETKISKQKVTENKKNNHYVWFAHPLNIYSCKSKQLVISNTQEAKFLRFLFTKNRVI